jgi:HSP20 family protein
LNSVQTTLNSVYSPSERSINLPAQVQAEQIEASFENGVLQVVVPKAEEAKPRRIQVRPGGRREAVAGNAPAAD